MEIVLVQEKQQKDTQEAPDRIDGTEEAMALDLVGYQEHIDEHSVQAVDHNA